MYNHTEYCRAWASRNPDKVKLYQARYKARHPDKLKEIKKNYKQTHPNWYKEWWQRIKDKVFSMYGNHCASCNFSDPRALQLDHVQNDGAKERIKKSTGLRTSNTQAAWLDASRNYQPEKYQILCANCNQIKRYENGDLSNSGSAWRR